MSRCIGRSDEDTVSLVEEDEIEVVLWDRGTLTVRRTRMFDLLSEAEPEAEPGGD